MIQPLLETSPRHPTGWRYSMAICGAYELRSSLPAFACTHILGIQARSLPFGGPLLAAERHLVLEFDDVAEPSLSDAPTIRHIEAAMEFVDALPTDAMLAIHCMQGISRSTALALGLLAREVPPAQAGLLLHSLRPFACPNALMIRLWDEELDLKGELIDVAERFPTLVWPGTGNEERARRAAMG